MEHDSNLRAAAEKLSTEAWIQINGRALQEPTALSGIPLPGGPSPEFQAAYVGSAGPDAMQEAGRFYRFVLEANERFRAAPIERLLDFGCGWGRHTRLLVRDVPEAGLYGADPDADAIQACRQHVPQAAFIHSATRPPLPFRDQLFDVVVAYSVFSHLMEINAANWIYELSRVLKPGGLLVATTHPIWLLDMVETLQKGERPTDTRWHQILARSWSSVEAARERYGRGEFLAADSGESATRDGYADVLVPKAYVWNVWGRIMEPLDYVMDQARVSQAAFVLRRRPSP